MKPVAVSTSGARAVKFLAVLGLAILVAGVQHIEAADPQNTARDWQDSAAYAAGFDLVELDRLTRDIEAGEFPNTHALLIERQGVLVYEKYFPGTDERWGDPLGERLLGPDDLHDLRSVSKSVTSLLLGIALGDEAGAAVNKPVDTYLPEASRVPGRDGITLHHVLTMTTGLEWNEMDVPYTNPENDEIRLYEAGDPALYVMSRPRVHEPGSAWYYSGGDTQVLASVISRLTGMPVDEFARQALFEPLGITGFEWLGPGSWTPDNPAAMSGLRLSARDLAKIGSLMLHGGRWQGRQIVPEAWVRLSGVRHVAEIGPWSDGGVWGYGYQWWIGDLPQGVRVIAGWGNGNQRLFIMPQEGMVVTIFAGEYNRFEGHSQRLLDRVLAARHKEAHPGFVDLAPADIRFEMIPGSMGATQAALLGDPSEEGLYVMRYRVPAGQLFPPHYHDQDRHVTVMAGTWAFGTGPSGDCRHTVPMPPGSYVFHPRGAVHFDGSCTNEPIEVQVIGIGPVSTFWVEKE